MNNPTRERARHPCKAGSGAPSLLAGGPRRSDRADPQIGQLGISLSRAAALRSIAVTPATFAALALDAGSAAAPAGVSC
ncbi:hypothetical protein [Streptomyces sp. NPDC002078]